MPLNICGYGTGTARANNVISQQEMLHEMVVLQCINEIGDMVGTKDSGMDNLDALHTKSSGD